MTRIFDALKKSQSGREPAVVPAPAMIHPVRPAPIPRTSLERLDAVPIGATAPFDDDVRREMAALRVHVVSALPARSPRLLMLVSGREGEGTSTVTLQLAQSLAREASQRVLVVDGNGLRPSPVFETARAAATETRERGCLHLLPLAERLRRSDPMTAVTIRDLIDVSANGYDWILLDGPPLLESPDAAPLAAQCDAVLLVVRAGATRRPVLVRALDLLRRSQANVLGTVLNRRRLEIPGFLYHRI
jgi:protein-tyrosine kinase